MNDLTGQTIAQYQLVEKLGAGGMAEVYKAYQSRLDRYVALKFIRPELAIQADFRQRFEQEARAIAKMSHGNIVHIYNFGEEDHRYFLVMEYIAGQTLKGRLQTLYKQDEWLSLSEVASIIQEVSQALAYAHGRGIIHRDVKPDNIMIESHGRAVLNDFGIAKILDANQEGSVTQTGAALGTPAYMAPEQVQGLKEQIGPATDLYALGIICYELLTGQPPFTADTAFSVMLKQVSDPVPLPRLANPQLSESLERFLLKALAKHPDDRFRTADAFGDAFATAVAATPNLQLAPFQRTPATIENITQPFADTVAEADNTTVSPPAAQNTAVAPVPQFADTPEDRTAVRPADDSVSSSASRPAVSPADSPIASSASRPAVSPVDGPVASSTSLPVVSPADSPVASSASRFRWPWLLGGLTAVAVLIALGWWFFRGNAGIFGFGGGQGAYIYYTDQQTKQLYRIPPNPNAQPQLISDRLDEWAAGSDVFVLDASDNRQLLISTTRGDEACADSACLVLIDENFSPNSASIVYLPNWDVVHANQATISSDGKTIVFATLSADSTRFDLYAIYLEQEGDQPLWSEPQLLTDQLETVHNSDPRFAYNDNEFLLFMCGSELFVEDGIQLCSYDFQTSTAALFLGIEDGPLPTDASSSDTYLSYPVPYPNTDFAFTATWRNSPLWYWDEDTDSVAPFEPNGYVGDFAACVLEDGRWVTLRHTTTDDWEGFELVLTSSSGSPNDVLSTGTAVQFGSVACVG